MKKNPGKRSSILRTFRFKIYRGLLPASSRRSKVRVFREGDPYYEALIVDFQRAQTSIDVEVYILEKDRVGTVLLDAMAAAVNRGVRVRLIIDGVGSQGITRYGLDEVREMGIELQVYRPINFRSFLSGSISHRRNHRKLVVVDGRVMYLGGMNMKESHSFRWKGEYAWKDSMLRVEGDVVADGQENFDLMWEHLDHPLSLSSAFKNRRPVRRDIQIVENIPFAKRVGYRFLFLSMIRLADRSITIQTAYFIPRLFMIRALKRKAKRGVRVRIILNEKSDVSVALWAGRAMYQTLLKSGVEIYERERRFSHAKIAIIDDRYLLMGSSNMDYRSFMHNLEIDALTRRNDLIQELSRDLEQEIEKSRRIVPWEWKKRPLSQKVLEKMAFAFRYWL